MPFDTWLVFLVVSILPALSPGPAIFLAISNALRFGPKATCYSALGNAAGLVVVGFAVAFGLGALMAASATLFTVVKFAGAAYLVYLGIKVWRDKSVLQTPEATVTALPRKPVAYLLEAFFVSVLNPKAILVIGALFPLFMDLSKPVVAQVFVMSITYAGLCLLNHFALAFLGGHVRRFFSSEKRMRALRRSLGGGFVAFGAALAATTR